MAIEWIYARELWIALGGMLGTLIAAKVTYFIINVIVKRITKKTETDLDDKILEALETPFIIGIFLIGTYYSIRTLPYIKSHFGILDNLTFIFAVIWSILVVRRLATVVLHKWISINPDYKNMPRLVFKATNAVVYIIGFLIVLNYFHVEITPLVATLGIGGIAVGFALQDTLSNFFSGLHIISDKPIRVGDFIELDGNVSGYVEDIGWRSTRIKTLPNTLVIVPNAKIASSIITNDTLPVPEMAIVIQCGVAYTSDLEKVENITIKTATTIQKTVEGAMKEFTPFIRYHTFGESNIQFSIILRVKTFVDKYLVTHEFIKALKKNFDKEGIEISWPVRKLFYANSPQGPIKGG